MLLRNTLSLTPCLALFLLACNDTTAHQQAQPQAAPPQVAAQNDQPADQPVTTKTETAKPSATILKESHPALRHHVAYAKHHIMARHASVAPAVTQNDSPAEPAEAAQSSPAAANVIVPPGTVLTVRLTQELASKTSNAGDAFTATVSEAVMVDGKLLIPEGSIVSGNVTEATPMGTIRQGVLHLTLNSINLNGQDQPIQTSTVSEVEKGKTESAGDLVDSAGGVTVPAAGLAGAGASAGLAGAGKSAGLAGAGLKTEAEAKASTVVAALTGNRDLVFPAQASMKFTLEQALDIKP
jgi:hypothetical protein